MRLLYFFVGTIIVSNTANGFDGSMMTGLQGLDYWETYFDNPSGSILGAFNCIMSVGSLVGLLLLPFALDKWGRKPGIVVGSVFLLVGVAVQAGSTSFGMFVGGRFLVGLGDVICVTTAPLLIAEIAHPQDRAILVTLMATAYGSGSFIAAWVTYATLQIQVSICITL
jgi:MFS family permease